MSDHRQGPLTKSDMATQYKYPPGAAGGDNPHLRGIPDSLLLNRSEWYEMLYFCNKITNVNGSGTKAEAQKAERLIQTHLPSNLRSHEHVTKWLVENWNKFN